MICGALYRNGLKNSIKLFVILAAVLTLYFMVITTMFDPSLGSALDEFAKAMPEIMAVAGMNAPGTALVDFMANYLYGFIMLVFPMLYAILTANRLVARHVDKGSMAYLLAAPATRKSIAFTQLLVLLTGVVAMSAFATLLGIFSAQLFFPGELEITLFLFINMGALALHLFISGICFIASCLFNDTKYSMAVGAGVPALCFIIQMMANSGEKLENAKYATFFTLFNPQGIIAEKSSAFAGIVILFAAALLLYALSIVIFSKKDIPV